MIVSDMEKMAEIVLNGEGEKLLELNSDLPEVQAFINNVPVYLVRIVLSKI